MVDNTLAASEQTTPTNQSAKNSSTVRVIAVTGGKGGVGKSNVSINLGMALAQLKQRVVLLDADLGLANIDVLLGLRPARNLEDVFAGECGLRDVIVDGPGGIRVIPASSGTVASRIACFSSSLWPVVPITRGLFCAAAS